MSGNQGSRSLRILIADNDNYYASVLGNALREHRCEVFLAQDGNEALDKARTNEPNCLFVDLHSAKQEGERLCRNLKKDARLMYTPIVLLTPVTPGNLSEEIISYADAILFKEQGEQIFNKILAVIDVLTKNGSQRTKLTGRVTEALTSSPPPELDLQGARNVLMHMPSGILLTRSNGLITFVNRYAQEALEKPSAQILGKHLEHVLPGVPFGTLVEKAKLGGEACSRAFYGKRLLGVSCRAFKEDPALAGALYLFLVEDQSWNWSEEEEQGKQKKSLQDEVVVQTRELEKTNQQLKEVNIELNRINHMKSEFLANMSHELRSPLNDILGFTQLLHGRTYGEITLRQEEAIGLVSESAHVLLNLINGILDYSKLEAGEVRVSLEQVNLSEMIQEIEKGSRHLVRGRPVKFRVDISPDLPIIRTDRDKLRQVVTNIVHNAIKFTKRGSIKLSVRPLTSLNKVEVCVEDTGIGIAKKDLKIIFEAFRQVDGSSTREFEGTGLGLAIASKLLNLLSGEIGVTSTTGVGSTFRVILPLEIEAKAGRE